MNFVILFFVPFRNVYHIEAAHTHLPGRRGWARCSHCAGGRKFRNARRAFANWAGHPQWHGMADLLRAAGLRRRDLWGHTQAEGMVSEAINNPPTQYNVPDAIECHERSWQQPNLKLRYTHVLWPPLPRWPVTQCRALPPSPRLTALNCWHSSHPIPSTYSFLFLLQIVVKFGTCGIIRHAWLIYPLRSNRATTSSGNNKNYNYNKDIEIHGPPH